VKDVMRFVRYGLPLLICAGGIAAIVARPDRNGLEGGFLIVSAGLSVWLLNWLYRVGVVGDRERAEEDEARAFFDRHGVWPDEVSAEERERLEDEARRPPTRPAQHRGPGSARRRPPRRRS
jgi:hypothetical protein